MGKGECLRQKGNIILASEGRCEGIQNRRSTDENHKYQMVERLKGTIIRKNKTYEQQKKYYDESGDFESLGAIFVYWLECGNETAEQMQETFREGNKECKNFILEDLYHLCDKKQLYQFVRIFYFGKR